MKLAANRGLRDASKMLRERSRVHQFRATISRLEGKLPILSDRFRARALEQSEGRFEQNRQSFVQHPDPIGTHAKMSLNRHSLVGAILPAVHHHQSTQFAHPVIQ